MSPKPRESILWIEGIGFSVIIAIIWMAEISGAPHFLFSESADFNWLRPLARTAVILTVWLAVHVATRKLLLRLYHLEEYLRICAWCRKVGHRNEWMTLEDFFGCTFTIKTTHGMCPECIQKVGNSDHPPTIPPEP